MGRKVKDCLWMEETPATVNSSKQIFKQKLFVWNSFARKLTFSCTSNLHQRCRRQKGNVRLAGRTKNKIALVHLSIHQSNKDLLWCPPSSPTLTPYCVCKMFFLKPQRLPTDADSSSWDAFGRSSPFQVSPRVDIRIERGPQFPDRSRWGIGHVNQMCFFAMQKGRHLKKQGRKVFCHWRCLYLPLLPNSLEKPPVQGRHLKPLSCGPTQTPPALLGGWPGVCGSHREAPLTSLGAKPLRILLGNHQRTKLQYSVVRSFSPFLLWKKTDLPQNSASKTCSFPSSFQSEATSNRTRWLKLQHTTHRSGSCTWSSWSLQQTSKHKGSSFYC